MAFYFGSEYAQQALQLFKAEIPNENIMDNVECLIRLPEVMRQCGLSKAAVYARMKRGQFPQNMKLGERCSAWRLAEVQDWVGARIAQRECLRP